MPVIRLRKKPVEVDAIIFTGSNHFEVFEFMDVDNGVMYNGGILVTTLEGNMVASKGDYIIKGVKGEFYPCKPDIAKLTYDEVESKSILEQLVEQAQDLKMGY